MKALHNLLFYLVYEHNGKLQNANEDLIGKFREEGIFIDDELESKMNEIYANEVSWKMFIPPLHKHPGKIFFHSKNIFHSIFILFFILVDIFFIFTKQ